MLDILPLGPHILAYRVEGAIEQDDIDRAFAEVDDKLAREGPLRAYVEVLSLGGITPDALLRDLWLGLQRLNLLPRIEKAALVTDLAWLRRIAGVENTLVPGLSLRAFPLAEQAHARAWIQS